MGAKTVPSSGMGKAEGDDDCCCWSHSSNEEEALPSPITVLSATVLLAPKPRAAAATSTSDLGWLLDGGEDRADGGVSPLLSYCVVESESVVVVSLLLL